MVGGRVRVAIAAVVRLGRVKGAVHVGVEKDAEM